MKNNQKIIDNEKSKDVKNDITEVNQNNNNTTNHKHIYISYTGRLIINLIIFMLTFGVSLYFAFSSFSLIKAHIVTYQETSDIDYKVYLKENSFYEQEYLGKDMSYISTLIDKINSDFIYNFKVNEKTNIKFTYNIIGKLLIMDNTGKNIFYQKDFPLLDNKEVEMTDSDNYTISENLDIDYSYYNTIANDFRNKFGVSTTSNFIVTLKVTGKSTNEEIDVGNSKTMNLTIPLSQREVNIKLETDTIKNNDSIVKGSYIEIKSYSYLIISVISLIISVISLVKLIRRISIINPPKTNYDKHISKILKEYDRFVANTTTGPIINDDDKVIEVHDFQELLDVRDSLKVPINYYNIVNHQKCLFYLHKDNLIYEYYVKASNLNNN